MTQEIARTDQQGFRVTVSGCGNFFCKGSESVLAAMARQGLKAVPVGCRGGGCGVCRVRVLSGGYASGKIARRHLAETEEREGYALACRLYPHSDLLVAPAPK